MLTRRADRQLQRAAGYALAMSGEAGQSTVHRLQAEAVPTFHGA